MLLVAVFTAAGVVATDVLVLSDEAYMDMFEVNRLEPAYILSRIAKIILFILVPGLLGYWRGQKFRLSKYLHYLLGVLPTETRDLVIDLAFEEAQKSASTAGSALGRK